METTISDREFAIIQELANSASFNQRVVAKKLGISLGLTNLIIKRLTKTGYIKIKQINRRNIRYLLTPKGFSEKARKSYNYTLRTITILSHIRSTIQNLIFEKYNSGIKNFFIDGDNELADLTESAFKKLDIPDINYYRRIKNGKTTTAPFVILSTSENVFNKHCVNLISYLAEKGLNV
ncbi:MAG: winged helix-turn-helix transcriptional regulator [Elusimicrobiota bacterium]